MATTVVEKVELTFDRLYLTKPFQVGLDTGDCVMILAYPGQGRVLEIAMSRENAELVGDLLIRIARSIQ